MDLLRLIMREYSSIINQRHFKRICGLMDERRLFTEADRQYDAEDRADRDG